MYWGLRAHTGDLEEQCYCIIHNSDLPQISKPTGQKMQKSIQNLGQRNKFPSYAQHWHNKNSCLLNTCEKHCSFFMSLSNFIKLASEAPVAKSRTLFRQAEFSDAGSSNTLPSTFITPFCWFAKLVNTDPSSGSCVAEPFVTSVMLELGWAKGTGTCREELQPQRWWLLC